MSEDRQLIDIPVEALAFYERKTVDVDFGYQSQLIKDYNDPEKGAFYAAQITGELVLQHMVKERMLPFSNKYDYVYQHVNQRAPYDFVGEPRVGRGPSLKADAKYRGQYIFPSFMNVFAIASKDFKIHLNMKTQVPQRRGGETLAALRRRQQDVFYCEVLNGNREVVKGKTVYRYFVTIVDCATLLDGIEKHKNRNLSRPQGTPSILRSLRVPALVPKEATAPASTGALNIESMLGSPEPMFKKRKK
jgi:hypothetical protein